MRIIENYSLQKLNTFGLQVKAKYYVELNSTNEVIKFLRSENFNFNNKLVIGGGSNLLFTKDFDGLIIKVNIPGIHVVKEDEHHFWVKSGAGIVWQDLIDSCIQANFGGIENLSLIPGTVGAAPIQNIGAYGVELKDTFEALEAIEFTSGKKRYFRKEDCHFGYRDSIFKNELKDKFLITNVVLKLTKKPVINISYGKIKEVLKESGLDNISVKDVSESIIKIRKSKLPDPKNIGNAGSFFKNPVIPNPQFEKLLTEHPQLPSYKQGNDYTKIPAAWLIEQCNFKGKSHNGAAVHQEQPLVLINKDNATGKDLIELSQKIQNKVASKFGIKLETEVRII